MQKFPDNFLWGTATSAHQIEGNNKNSDWWEWEQTKEQEKRQFPLEPSGLACDSYNRYEEDFDLCKELNNNAVRISIEWARLEPKEGVFDLNEFEHYRKVLKAAKDRGLKTFVTLHHFSSPLWFAEKGGWHNLNAPTYFAKYAKKCAEELDNLIDAYLTINEPQVYTLLGYTGLHDWMHNEWVQWPPAKRSYILAFIAQTGFMRGHNKAAKAIKSVNKSAQVGLVININCWEKDPSSKNPLDNIAVAILRFIGSDFFLYPIKKHLDMIGLNYYFTTWIKNFKMSNPNDKVSDLGWWINPNGLEKVLLSLKKYNLPIYVTENGIADAKDQLRSQFVTDHLKACANAIKGGVNLLGYFYWSLLDNFEWHQGFWPRFGLVEIDRENNLQRKPRPSFYNYAQIAKDNAISE